MRFDIKREVLVEKESEEDSLITGYVNEPLAIFAICRTKNVDFKWSIIHRPSGSIVFNIFKTKSEVEKFFDYFAELTEIDSLIFLNPHEENLLEDLNPYLLKAYKKFFKKHRRS
jgi:hypothetical protein